MHGIFTDAGEQPNVVPRRAAAEWYVRSATVAGLEALKERVLDCLEAGARAAGCTMDVRWIDPPYDDMVPDPRLLERYHRNAAALGRPFADPAVVGHVVGSTDMGNVSHVVPSIHPMIAVAPPGIVDPHAGVRRARPRPRRRPCRHRRRQGARSDRRRPAGSTRLP